MEECGFCKEKEEMLRKYEQDIEREKIVHCHMALEREKIAKGMQCTKLDEIRLKEMQKMQMREKENIEREEQKRDMLWHMVLMDEVRMKEERERKEADRIKREMYERRMAYDEQIASANKKLREAVQCEREKENRRLEKMKLKMEQDYYEAIKRKKEQQMKNRKNFIEGHNMKISLLQEQKRQERDIDNRTINDALEALRRERQKKRDQIKALQIEKQVFVENFNREREMMNALERDADKIAQEWKEEGENQEDEKYRHAEQQKYMNREKAAHDYRGYLEEKKIELERQRQERDVTMHRVKRRAVNELQRCLDSANEELRHQIEYRNSLTRQIRENQKIAETELRSIEQKQRPFTKKPLMFGDAMKKVNNTPCISTNPVHPFQRILQSRSQDPPIVLPLLYK